VLSGHPSGSEISAESGARSKLAALVRDRIDPGAIDSGTTEDKPAGAGDVLVERDDDSDGETAGGGVSGQASGSEISAESGARSEIEKAEWRPFASLG
jgi:hypothetical protein